MAKNKAKNIRIGKIGEDIACAFLMKQGFRVISRNYLKKWGEIDIIATKLGITHFIEVKTVSCEKISHETGKNPAENIHHAKIERLKRVIQTYLLEEKVSSEWCFDVVLVRLSVEAQEAQVEYLPDQIL